jgi:hypothetical protein
MSASELAVRRQNAIPNFKNALEDYHVAHFGRSFPSSPFELEKASYIDPETVEWTYDFPVHLLDCAIDNMFAFYKTMIAPVALYGPWVCVRAAFETSAYCVWLTDPMIGVTERVNRAYGFAFKSLTESTNFQRAYTRAKERRRAPRTNVNDRLHRLEKLAQKEHVPVIRNGLGAIIEIGRFLPGATRTVTEVFDDEESYRLLSAMTHGYPWVAGLIVKVADNADPASTRIKVQRQMPPENVSYMSARAVRAVAMAAWQRSQQLDWDFVQLGRLLEATFDEMDIQPEHRFWLSAGRGRTKPKSTSESDVD